MGSRNQCTTQVFQVVVSRDERGYGMKVSGDNPVFVQSVKEGGAAERAGLHAGDKIIKVNDINVISSRHTEVVELIRASSQVILTVQHRTSCQKDSDNNQMRSSSSTRITGPKPVDNIKQYQLHMEKEQHYKLMIEKEQRYLDMLKGHTASSPDDEKHAEVIKTERNLQTLRIMLEKSQTEIPTLIDYEIGWNSGAFPEISAAEATRRFLFAECTSGDFVDECDNKVTPPGTPPPPYPYPAIPEAFINLYQSQNVSSNSIGCLPESNIRSLNQRIISMEDEDLSDEEELDENQSFFKSLSCLWGHLPHLAVFLNYLLLNSNPSSIFFYLLTDLYKEGNTKEMRKWAFEIHSSFLVPGAPLRLVNIDDNIAYEVDGVLSREYDKEEILRKVFWKARSRAKEELSCQLAEFQHKRTAGLGTMFGPTDQALDEVYTDKSKEMKMYESLFIDKLQPYLEEVESENYNSTTFYLGVALITVLVRIFGMRSPALNTDRCPMFVSKERTFRSKFVGKYSRKLSYNGHQLIAQQYLTVVACNQCHHIIYGLGPQGYQCSACLLNLHKHCVKLFEDGCPGPITKKDRGLGKYIRIRHENIEPRRKQSRLFSPIDRERKSIEGSVHNDLEIKDADAIKLVGDVCMSSADGQNHSGENQSLVASDCSLVNKANDGLSMACVSNPVSQPKKTSNIGRSESVKECSEKRKQRRNISDPSPNTANLELDSDHPGFSNTESTSTSESSFSFGSRLSESPENSLDPARIVQSERKSNSDWISDSEEEVEEWEEQFANLQPHEKKRLDVINELLHTENSHVRNLRVLHDIFYKSLLDSQVLRADELALIFPNLKQIFQLHFQFNKELKKLRKRDIFCKNLGSMLINWFGGPVGESLQESGALFCERQQLALEFIKEKRKRDSKFDGVLNECERQRQCRRLPLQGILPVEMQRLSKYPLLLERLINSIDANTEEDEIISDLLKLQQAYNLSKEILNYVNEAAKLALNRTRLENLQRHLDTSNFERSEHPIVQEFKSIDLTRYKLILEGSMQLRRPNKGPVPVHVLLLEEAVIILQKEGDRFLLKFFQSGSSAQPPLSPIIKISTLLVRINAVCKNALFLVNTSTNNSQMYDLLTEDDSKRDIWFKHFSDASSAYSNKSGKYKGIHSDSEDSETLQALRLDPTVDGELASAVMASENNSEVPEDDEKKCSKKDVCDEENFTEVDRYPEKLAANNWSLIQPSQVQVEEPPILMAEITLTPLEQIRRKNDEVRTAISEKQKLISNLLNIPHQDFKVIAEMAKEEDSSGYLSERILAAIYQVDLLHSAVNEALNLSDSVVVASSAGKQMVCERSQDSSYLTYSPSVPVGPISEAISSLSFLLTSLLDDSKNIDEERTQLRRELYRVREQLHESERLHHNSRQTQLSTDVDEVEGNQE